MSKNRKIQDHYFTPHPRSEKNLSMVHTHIRRQSFSFLTASGVFSNRRIDPGTKLLAESMILPSEGRVLDLGCGYGVVGIAAAAFNHNLELFLVDINERAVWLSKQNIKLNNIDNAGARQGSLYEPVEDLTFNCILTNPPVSAGMETVRAIVLQAPQHLEVKGSFQMVVRSKIGGKTLSQFLENVFGNMEVLSRKSGYRVFLSEKH
ncbi:MAG: class I SAM-dependent methyltransferase [Candidatus Bathyarchaeota archaeon]|jgi:16S rRNA (guanine1207-N2)-methyltransferase